MEVKLHSSSLVVSYNIKFGGQLDILRTSLVVIQSVGLRSRLVVIQCSNRHKNHPKKS